MSKLQSRLGFALPLVMVFLVVMSMAIAASLAASAAETGMSTAQRGQNRAYALAEMGLQTFLVKRDSLCANSGSCLPDPSAATTGKDSVLVKFNGGYAVVLAELLRPQIGNTDTIPAMFFLRSRGVDSLSKLRGKDTTS